MVKAPCRLGCDDLFERGYMAIDDTGRIVTPVPEGIATEAWRQVVAWVEGRTWPTFGKATRECFVWHYSHTFRG